MNYLLDLSHLKLINTLVLHEDTLKLYHTRQIYSVQTKYVVGLVCTENGATTSTLSYISHTIL